MLQRFVFCYKRISWAWACVFSESISILINGSPSDEINIQRDLKQGGPLTPFLLALGWFLRADMVVLYRCLGVTMCLHTPQAMLLLPMFVAILFVGSWYSTFSWFAEFMTTFFIIPHLISLVLEIYIYLKSIYPRLGFFPIQIITPE